MEDDSGAVSGACSHHPGGELPIAQRAVLPEITRPFDLPDEFLEAVYIGDDESLTELYKLRLELDGYRVTVVSTPADALAACRRRVPDIVFVDAGATAESVLEAIASLRRHRQLKDVPIVLLWGGATDPPAIDGLQLGVSNFLVKAINVATAGRWPDSLGEPVVSRQLH
jgi:CheY-like chemotaxis protein